MNPCKAAFRNISAPFAAVFLLASPVATQKLTAELVVRNHLNSFGSPEARAGARTRVCEGVGELKILEGGFGAMRGPAGFVAQDGRQALEIQFGNPDYSREAVSFTGEEVQAAPVLPGRRSRLGDFLYTYPQLMREGLFGGVYATGWPLLDLERHQPRLRYRGVKKVDSQKLHQLDYEMNSERRDVNVKLFFDEKTFRHVRTQYTLTVRHGMRTNPNQSLSAQEAYTRYELLETFSEFQRTDGLDLPFRWNVRFKSESDSGQELGARSFVWEWKLKFDRIHHNQQLNPDLFDVMN